MAVWQAAKGPGKICDCTTPKGSLW